MMTFTGFHVCVNSLERSFEGCMPLQSDKCFNQSYINKKIIFIGKAEYFCSKLQLWPLVKNKKIDAITIEDVEQT